MRDLVSPCMLRAAGPEQISHFMVERLGVFGSWYEQSPVPPSVLDAQADGPSWCINNCFNLLLLHHLRKSRRVNATIGAALAALPLVRQAFERGTNRGLG